MDSPYRWKDYIRTHADFILASLFEPDSVRAAAGAVSNNLEQVRIGFVSGLLASQISGEGA